MVGSRKLLKARNGAVVFIGDRPINIYIHCRGKQPDVPFAETPEHQLHRLRVYRKFEKSQVDLEKYEADASFLYYALISRRRENKRSWILWMEFLEEAIRRTKYRRNIKERGKIFSYRKDRLRVIRVSSLLNLLRSRKYPRYLEDLWRWKTKLCIEKQRVWRVRLVRPGDSSRLSFNWQLLYIEIFRS